MNWFWRYGIPYMLVAAGAIFFLATPFSRRYRQSSRWLRSMFLLVGLAGLGWSALGFFLLSHQHGRRSDLSWSWFWAIDHVKCALAGIALGLLIALLVNPELWRRPSGDVVGATMT